MKLLQSLLFIFLTVAIAVSANSISTIWARGDSRLSLWLLAIILISPLVFITFGLVTSRHGLAIASGVIDSLLTVSSLTVGLVFFGEWNKISALQYVGLGLALAGVALMVFFPKHSI